MQSAYQTARQKEPGSPQESLADLLGRLATESASLVKDEISLAEQELKEKASGYRSGLLLLVIGGAVATVCLGALSAAAVIGLGDVIGFALSALIIAIVLAIIAGVIISVGTVHVRQASLNPRKAAAELKQTVQTLKEDLTHG